MFKNLKQLLITSLQPILKLSKELSLLSYTNVLTVLLPYCSGSIMWLALQLIYVLAVTFVAG